MILKVVNEYIKISKNGNSYLGICPFHDDKKPSLHVSETKNGYKCFACGASGGPIKFVQEFEKISSDEAKLKINQIVGYEAFKTNDQSIDKNWSIREIASKTYNLFLVSSKEYKSGYEYLANRKITLETINLFNLGYAIDHPNLAIDIISNKNNQIINSKIISDNDLNQSGLLVLTKNGDYKQAFTNRIMFPLYDFKNHIIGFTGRDITEVSAIKYLNSSNLKKDEFLYGAHLLDSQIEDLVICEGMFDCITLQQLKINAIALMGIEFTYNQLNLLKRFNHLRRINICLDNDSAGIKASFKLANELKKLFPNAFIGFFDYYGTVVKDVNELYVTNEQLLISKLVKFVDYNTYYLNYILSNNALNRNQKIQSIAKIAITKSIYRKLILNRLNENGYDEIVEKFIDHDLIRKLILSNENLVDGYLLEKIKNVYRIK